VSFPVADPNPRLAVAPNLAPLRAGGWNIQSVTGAYVVAWREAVEVVFVWRDHAWHRLAARSLPARAA